MNKDFKIYNKIESAKWIKNLKLNILPEKIFFSYNKEEILKFLESYPVKYYAIRDKSLAMSKIHQLAVPYDEVCNYCEKLKMFSINVSSINYSYCQICCGELIIDDSGNINCILSNNPKFSLRDCYSNPDFKGQLSIFDNKFKDINGFEEIVNYILRKGLQNIIVEFTVFNENIGINNEKVIIWELRTDY